MKEKKNENLIYEGNAFYEVDRECMKRGLNRREEKKNTNPPSKNPRKHNKIY